MRWLVWIAAVGLLWIPSRAEALERCPQEGVIADLDCELNGATSKESESSLEDYPSDLTSCTVNVKYPCKGDVFEVFLNKGNDDVGFELDLEGSQGDLVLILTDEEGTCLVNSPDFIGRGAGPETIPAASYDEGTYFIYVDTATLKEGDEEVCAYGEYTLAVTGTNPSELDLSLTSSREPDRRLVIAGRDNLVHEMTVENPGPFRATGLEIKITTTSDLTDVSGPDPEVDRGKFRDDDTWTIDRLESGESGTLTVVRTVGSGAPDGELIETEARLTVKEENLGDDFANVSNVIRRKTELRLETLGPDDAVAGDGDVEYTVTIHNDGPSDASVLVLAETLDLPDDVFVRSVTSDTGDRYDPAQDPRTGGTWTVNGLGRDDEATLRIVLDVRSSAAAGAVIHSRTEIMDPVEVNTGESVTELSTPIRREVDLFLDTRVVKPEDDKLPDGATLADDETFAGGGNLVFTVLVRNDGPSDASGLVLTETLTRPRPAVVGVDFTSRPNEGAYDEENGIWTVGVLKRGDEATLEIVLDVVSSVREGARIRTRTVVTELNEPNVGETNTKEKVTVRRKVTLDLETTAVPLDGVVAGAGNLVYTVSVANLGPSDASGLVLKETPTRPDGVGVPSFTASPDDYDEDTGTWTVGVLTRGGEPATLEIVLPVLSSAVEDDEITTVTQVDKIAEPNAGETETDASTTIRRETDLALKKEAAGTVVSGDNLVYTLTVENFGDSDSTGATICDTLPDGVEFVSSPDACRAADGTVRCKDDEVPSVTCRLDPVGDEETAEPLRFVALVRPETRSPITNNARVAANERDKREINDSWWVETTVLDTDPLDPPALTLRMSDSEDPVGRGDPLTYTLKVVNDEPSTLGGIVILVTLDQDVTLLEEQPPGCVPVTEGEDEGKVACRPADGLPPGETEFLIAVQVNDPTADDFLISSAELRAKTVLAGTAEEATSIFEDEEEDADLAVAQLDSADPALPDTDLIYTIQVWNNGPAPSSGGTLEVELPAETTFDGAVSAMTCVDPPVDVRPQVVTCTFGTLAPEDGPVEVEVTVQVDAIDGLLVSTATVSGNEPDPNADGDPNFNNGWEESTTVVAPLLLPVFAVLGGEERDVNTFFAVRNTTEDAVDFRYEVFDAAGTSLLGEDGIALAGHATYASDLRQVLGEPESAAGFVAVAPEAGSGALSGDERRVDLSNGLASGNRLLDVHPSRVPRLCRRWDAGFLNGGAFDGGTSFLFFVPEQPLESNEPLVTGRVYSADGKLVQRYPGGEDEVPSARAFELDAREDLDLLAKSGTVEWTFREGVKGSVAALFRAAGRVSVAVPAHCKDELPDAGDWLAPHLYLHRFEVDPSTGTDTFFTLRNGGDDPVALSYEYFNRNGDSIRRRRLDVPAHGARTVDVKEDLGSGKRSGFAAFTAVDPEIDPEDPPPLTEVPALHGELFLRDRQSASGEVLVDTRPELEPRRLCGLWNAPVVADDVFDRTDYAFFLTSPSGGQKRKVDYRVYDEDGDPLVQTSFEEEGQVFVRSSEDLGFGPQARSVEWQLPPDTSGHVSAVFSSASGLSVAVAAVCLDTPVPAP